MGHRSKVSHDSGEGTCCVLCVLALEPSADIHVGVLGRCWVSDPLGSTQGCSLHPQGWRQKPPSPQRCFPGRRRNQSVPCVLLASEDREAFVSLTMQLVVLSWLCWLEATILGILGCVLYPGRTKEGKGSRGKATF